MKTLLVGCFVLGLTFASCLTANAKFYCCPVKDKCAPKDKCAKKEKCTVKCDKCGTCPSGTKEVNKFWIVK